MAADAAARAAMGGDTLAVWPTAAAATSSSGSSSSVVLLADESRIADQEDQEEEEAGPAALPRNTSHTRRAIHNFSSQLRHLIGLYYSPRGVFVAYFVARQAARGLGRRWLCCCCCWWWWRWTRCQVADIRLEARTTSRTASRLDRHRPKRLTARPEPPGTPAAPQHEDEQPSTTTATTR